MESEELKIPTRRTSGISIELPEEFFRWTILPFAHCFGVAAFAFHVERGYRRSALLRPKLDDPNDLGILDWFDLRDEGARISTFYGALRVERPFAPFTELAISDEGKLYASVAEEHTYRDQGELTVLFDASRPNTRQQVKRLYQHSIVLEALQVRGRPNSTLAKKQDIEWGCFMAGLEWDRDRALFVLDGAKLYDVELRVNPALLPPDMTLKPTKSESANETAKRSGILDAARQLWPDGIPAGMTVKERDNAIMAFLERKGVLAPSARTIRRALQDKV